jgi:hypothetical protein
VLRHHCSGCHGYRNSIFRRGALPPGLLGPWLGPTDPIRVGVFQLSDSARAVTTAACEAGPVPLPPPDPHRSAGDRTTARRVRPDDLGAWLLKGNADRSDLLARFQADPRIERWCVQPGYRARLMTAGQPVIFWASGSRGRLRYGVWGRGRLRGAAVPDPEHGQWWVPLDLRILPAAQWVERAQVRADPRLAGLEVLRQPQAGNPSFLTVAQFAALTEHLEAGPA